MKVLVTGANGYLGRGIVKYLLNSKIDVVATDFKCAYVDKRAVIRECSLFTIDDPYSYFDKPDVLLHLAWRDSFVHNSMAHLEDLPHHYNFIKSLASQGIKKIVVMGSMHEVGFHEGSINENTPCKPLSLYGIAKNALRQAVEQLCIANNVKFQWLRGFYIVSNEEYGNSIFSKIVQAENEGKTLFPFTSGKNQYDFIDYDEFCNQVSCVVQYYGIDGIINICSGYPERLSDRVERFIRENDFNIALDYGKYPDRPYDSKAVWGDNDRINNLMMKFNNK